MPAATLPEPPKSLGIAPKTVPVQKSGSLGGTSEIKTKPPERPEAPEPEGEVGLEGLKDKLSIAMGEQPKAAPAAPKPAEPPAKPATPKPEPKAEILPEPEDNEELEAMLAGKGKARKAEAEPEEEPAPEEPAAAKPEPELKGPAGLRRALENERKRAAELERALKEIKAKQNEAGSLAEQFEALKKSNEEAESKLRVLDYMQSGEYNEKHYKPLQRAYQQAYELMKELYVGEGEERRTAKPEDFEALMRVNTGDAITKAKELFGDAAMEVLAQRREILNLSKNSQAALEEWRTKGGEMMKQKQAEAVAAREKLNNLWNEELEKSTKAYPELFEPSEDDTEGNKLLAKGIREADEAMGDLSRVSPEQRVAIHAKIRNRAAAWPREVWRRKQAEARVEELEAALAEYEESKPKIEKGSGKKPASGAEPSPEPSEDSMEGMLAKLSKLAG